MMKKNVCLFLALVMILGMFSACGKAPVAEVPEDSAAPAATNDAPESSNEEKKDVVLTFMYNETGKKQEAMEAAVRGFEAETGYTVEFTAPGTGYEELMKTKMAANELPDIFCTHGWSVLRYGEYLYPLNDMSFAGNIDNQIAPVITDAAGNLLVLPVDRGVNGIIYNVDILEQCNIDVDSLKTWDDFEKACASIADAGFIPIAMGNKDVWPIASAQNYIAGTYFLPDQEESMKAGNFDKETWKEMAQMIVDWTKNGYFNVDALTADYATSVELLATQKAAFNFTNVGAFAEAKQYTEDAHLGLMPIPGIDAEHPVRFVVGEGVAVGIWKDSANLEYAKEFLEYLARPDVCAELAKVSGLSAGLTNVEVDLGEVGEYFEKYNWVEGYPIFDRVCLPSGMWDIVCSTGAELLMASDDAAESAATQMDEAFYSKYGQ